MRSPPRWPAGAHARGRPGLRRSTPRCRASRSSAAARCQRTWGVGPRWRCPSSRASRRGRTGRGAGFHGRGRDARPRGSRAGCRWPRAPSARERCLRSAWRELVAYVWRNCTPHPTLSPEGRGSSGLTLAFALVAAELVLDGVDQSLPGRFDDVVGYAHRAPRLVAVAGGDQHAGPGSGALALVEDANLVVEQAHLAQARIEVLERFAESVVESVDGAVARGRGMLGDALDLEAHRGFRHRLRLAALLLDDDAEAVELEVGLVVAERALHEELEGGLGALELEPLVLHALEHLEDAPRLRGVLVEVDAVFAGLPEDVGLPGQLGDEHPTVIAHDLGIDVLVGLGVLEHGGDVDAALVGEGGVAHVGLSIPRLAIGELGHEAGDVAQLTQVLARNAVEPHLEHHVGYDRHEVGVAAALPVAVDGPLHVVHALGDGGEGVGHRALRVVVDVDAQRRLRTHVALHLADDLRNLMGQPASVGVAEDEAVSARRLRRLEGS